jgi:squalene-associated FAD-dependent desaturase
MADTRNVAVIGGGWAGCAAAVELAQRGHRVTLLEAARTLGGRARSVEIDGRHLDNGQHILLGAYSESLRLMRLVGIDPRQALLRLPLQMRYPKQDGSVDFLTPSLPAPLHVLIGLLRAKGLDRDDKMSLARFFTAVRWMGWRQNQDCSVAELLERFDQTDRLVKRMWNPLCIAALNTPPERASAQVFLNVLRDSIGGRRMASDMLIPRVDLSELFPEKAVDFIHQRGGTVFCGTSVKRLWTENERWRVDVSGANTSALGETPFDAIIVATQPSQAAGLLGELIDTSTLSTFAYEPITTCYLQYAPDTRLPHPFFALPDDPDHDEWGQFVFDRGVISPEHPGLLAVVISASGEAIESGHQALAESVATQLAKAFHQPALRHPIWTKVISEKRATFSCRPSLKRPVNATGRKGLLLAGDYTASDYPATLESAIRSGIQAAREIAF